MVPPPFGRQNATRLVPGLLPQDSNGLPDFGWLLSRKANRHQSTARRLSAAKTASHLQTPLHPRLSMFGMETPRDATPARSLSTCRPLREHLPSSSIAPVRISGSDAYRTGFAWLSPIPKNRGGETGLFPLSLPSDRII